MIVIYQTIVINKVKNCFDFYFFQGESVTKYVICLHCSVSCNQDFISFEDASEPDMQ